MVAVTDINLQRPAAVRAGCRWVTHPLAQTLVREAVQCVYYKGW